MYIDCMVFLHLFTYLTYKVYVAIKDLKYDNIILYF